MTTNKFGTFILFLAISILGCKNSSSESKDLFSRQDTLGLNSKIKVAPTNAVRPDTPIKSSFDNPVAMANNKYSHYDTILIRDLSNKYWKFDGGIDGAKNITEKEMEGFWLKFNDNGKYEKGTFNKTTSKGNYTVDNQGFIEMTPNDGSEKRSEWQSKFNNDMLILVGTPKYNDNQIQMRLSRIPEKPKMTTK